MQKRRLWRCVKISLLVALVFGGGTQVALATTSSSNHYQVTETEFGASSTSESCSDAYCARASIGDMAAGSSKSAKSTATFGSVTSDEPLLEVIVDPGTSDLGTLTTEHTATKTMTVRVRNYLSDGYTLQITGNPPKYGGHTLDTPTTPTASKPGTEQFGINAVVNTTPAVGLNPVQVPSSETSFGIINDDYGTPNLFKYSDNDVVAHSDSESGRTDYTVSMIVNVSNSTPAGHYTGDFSAVVIPVY